MQRIENEKKKMPYNVLDAIERIGKRYANTENHPHKTTSEDESLEKVMSYLGTDRLQTILFCGIYLMCLNGKSEVGVDDVICFFGIWNDDDSQKTYSKELRKMFRQRLLAKKKPEFKDAVSFLDEYGKDFYRPSIAVLDAIKENEFYRNSISEKEKERSEVFDFINDFGKMCKDNESLQEIKAATTNLEESLLPTSPIHELEKRFDMYDRIILYELCYMAIYRNDEELFESLRVVFPDDIRRVNVKAHEIESGESPLVKDGFVKMESDRKGRLKRPKVTGKGLESVFCEDAVYMKNAKQIKAKDLLSPAEIEEKELFYPEEVKKRLSVFCNSIVEDNYRTLRERMANVKFSGGVCCLFYGPPGTGKTEGVYQIAKATNRKIFHVDISNVRAKYVGETERNTKRIFTRYKKLCKACEENGENTPILLLNEADAVFSKRLPIEGRNSTIQQMENTMQNIMLEQMEKLDGILVATTNLEESLDDAFERRFLFKVNFPKPEAGCRAKIWRSKVSALTDEETRVLAERYEFSGGEIDNIVRKSIMKSIVTGKDSAFADFDEFCREEKIERKGTRKIGF